MGDPHDRLKVVCAFDSDLARARGTVLRPPSAVSSFGGFRTPAAEYAAPSLKRPASETLHNSGSRPYSITSSARARSGGGLRDQLRRKPWPRRSTSWTSITSVVGAILVNATTLEGWYLLQGQAVAISRTTGICALLFSGSSRRKGERGEIGVARIECSGVHEQ